MPPKKTRDTENYHRIRDYLRSISPESLHAKAISRRLNINYNTVRSYLSRLAKEGEVKRTLRGLYRAKLDIDTLRKVGAVEDINIRIHGLKVEGRLCVKQGAGYFADADAFRPPGKCTFEDDNRRTFQAVYEGRVTTFTVHDDGRAKGLVEVFLKSSRLPMSISEFMRWEAYLHGVFPNFEVMDFKVIQIGLNCDYKRLRLDGVKSIKLQTFKNAWFQIYEKAEDILRIEGHLVTEIDLKECLDILSVLVSEPRLKPGKDLESEDGMMFQ